MQAIVCTKYGPPEVLQQKQLEKPVPADNQVLIKVHATSVNFGDTIARNFKAVTPSQFNMPFILWLLAKISFGLSQPNITILGSEFSGEIETVGNAVKRFKKGDQVFGYPGQSFGAYAEYLCLPEDACLTTKPANMTHQEAAAMPYGSIMALNLLRKMDLQPGQKVLINGASGSIGSAAVQIAKYFGAEVTAVCGTPGLEFVKSLGADHVIDYTKQDFTQNGETYDLIFDVLGRSSFSRCQASLKPHGILLYASFKLKQLLQMLWTSKTSGKKVVCAFAPGSTEDLISVKELIEAGKLKTIIAKTFPLDQAAQAHRYAETAHKSGPIVITVP